MMNKKMWLSIEGVDNPIDALFDSYFDNRGCDSCKCQRKSEPGAREFLSHQRPRKSEPLRSRIFEPPC